MKQNEDPRPCILIIDDEADIREILQGNLETRGYDTLTAASAEAGLSLLNDSVSLILLDVMLGGMSGFAMARHLRKDLHSRVPIIFLTARDTENDLLTGFSAGGDDYVAKPFSIHEVLARVAAVLRRGQSAAAQESEHIAFGGIEIEPERKLVRAEGREVILTPKEYGILKLLMEHPGRVFSREEILQSVWENGTFVLERTIDVHITRIRAKLGEAGNQIINRQGYGYCFQEK